MLDQLLVAQASLNAIRVLTNVALVSMALLVTGGVGFVLAARVPRRLSRTVRVLAKIALGLGTLGAVLLVAIIGLAALRRPERFAWTVDLRTEQPLQLFQQHDCAKWGSGAEQRDDCIYEGETNLTAQFSGGRSVTQRGRALWASGRNGRLTSIHHFLQPMTLAGVRATVEPLIDPWHLRRERFDDWLTRAGTAERAAYFTPAEDNRAAPWLELSVRPLDTTDSSERLFAVSLMWRWKDE